MTAEINVGTDANEAVYVVRTPEGTQVIPWDEVVDLIQRMSLELVFRDAGPIERGTVATYDQMKAMEEALYKRWRETGEQSVRDLSPQLAGLEAQRVRAETKDGQHRVFTVGKSDDWMPHHIEERYAGESHRAEQEYEWVEVID